MEISDLVTMVQNKDFNSFDQKAKEYLNTKVAEKLAEKGYAQKPNATINESAKELYTKKAKCSEQAGDKYDWDYDNPKLIAALNKCDKKFEESLESGSNGEK